MQLDYWLLETVTLKKKKLLALNFTDNVEHFYKFGLLFDMTND